MAKTAAEGDAEFSTWLIEVDCLDDISSLTATLLLALLVSHKIALL